ncbi:hypothetical protein TIFTF001_047185 [Ficus carica]|uniref:Uncharacterized protein n=1 Tax=Ficus carica TaxID=3494 RepID=A0AA87YR29_FICCA|nr:hypothetical protein TIFTF001_047185 [Ficus carica]
MGSSRLDLRSGAHLCPFCHQSTPVNASQSWSTPVKAGQCRSTLVNAGQLSPNFGRSPFRPISMFRTCLQPQICDMESRRLRMAIKSSVARN